MPGVRNLLSIFGMGSFHGYKIYLSELCGTGKIHVIKLICQDVIYFLQQSMRVQPGEVLVLLTAQTGPTCI